MIRKRQFSLGSLLIATAFLAGAYAAAKLSMTSGEPIGLVFGTLVFAPLLAGGIGSLYDRLWDWVAYAVLIDIVILSILLRR